MKKRDILFLCQYSYPEFNSSATLPFDTATYLAQQGKTVSAMCGYPKEYTKERHLPLREEIDGVHIRRIRYLQLSRGGKLGRLINYFSFTVSALLHILELRKYKSVIVYSNPPILPIVTILANILFKTDFIFVAYDIYPEVAYASHSVEPGSLIDSIMHLINRQLYSRAKMIVALTEEMRQFILANRSESNESQVCVIHNWAHEGRNIPSSNAYQQFGYQKDDFIVSYFRNLGVCQDIGTICSAMRILKDDSHIRFFVAGHGSKMKLLQKESQELPNVTVTDFLVGEKFEDALAISSCCIVSLEPGLHGTCAPSKFYSYLQSGCPIIAVAEDGSYLSREIQTENIGYHVRNEDGSGLAAAIQDLAHDQNRCRVMRENALSLYEREYAKPIAMRKYNDIVSKVLFS